MRGCAVQQPYPLPIRATTHGVIAAAIASIGALCDHRIGILELIAICIGWGPSVYHGSVTCDQ